MSKKASESAGLGGDTKEASSSNPAPEKPDYELRHCKTCNQMTNWERNPEGRNCTKCKPCNHEWGDGHTPDGKTHWESCIKCNKPKPKRKVK